MDGCASVRHAVLRCDPTRLCAAIVDGLTFGGNIIETGTDSCRLADTENQQQPP